MEFDKRTIAAVREHFGHERALNTLLAHAEPNDRFVMVASEGIGKYVENVPAGIYASLDDVVTGHDWSHGVPEYLIDLAAKPEEAILGIDICIAPNGERAGLGDFGIEYA